MTFLKCFLLTIFFAITSKSAVAQSVSKSWLTTASQVCGGGLAVEAKAKVVDNLEQAMSALDAKADESGSFGLIDVDRVLRTMPEYQKSQAYKRYTECVVLIAQKAATSTGITSNTTILDVDSAPATLEIIPSKVRFTIQAGSTVAVFSNAHLLTLTHIDFVRGGAQFKLSNLATGKVSKHTAHEAEFIKVADCILPVYEISKDEGLVSMYSLCEGK